MDYLENQLFEYLKARPNRFLSAKEIARDVVDKKTYRENPMIAKGPLTSLADKGLLQTNEMGHFCYALRPLDGGPCAKQC